jgi:hypothetical protein
VQEGELVRMQHPLLYAMHPTRPAGLVAN